MKSPLEESVRSDRKVKISFGLRIVAYLTMGVVIYLNWDAIRFFLESVPWYYQAIFIGAMIVVEACKWELDVSVNETFETIEDEYNELVDDYNELVDEYNEKFGTIVSKREYCD